MAKVSNKRNKEATLIGAKIKELRLINGLTQEELSEKIGIDNKRLSRIETGVAMPSLTIALALNKFFNFNFLELIDSFLTETVDIPDNFYVQSVNILKSAKNDIEKECYLNALKHTYKCINLKD